MAFKLEAHSVIIANCVSFMFMTLSIDRVLAVAFPVFYVQLNFRLYICLHIMAIVIFFIFNISTLMISVNEYPDWPVTGYISDLFIGVPSHFNIAIVLLIILIVSTLAHIIVGILAKYKGGKY
ncbi:unnamed protein product [Meloidogyne enterolobii]|uniref:Uncharacterized protein n=1 Tax=Meloidogyne enterolobii TaxID=390850 RepID=A0ACB0ZMS7_MELEN